ncbi:MAG: DUF192 domain-containing protein [Candidatus Microsaccharimonas sp.]
MDKLSLIRWRPHTTLILIFGAVSILIGLFISITVTAFRPTTEVRLGSGVYALWVANTDADREKGLSDTDSLDVNGGLLMEFDTDRTHGIWMKDMNFPLDIIWLDKNQKIIYIVKNAPPEVPVSTIYRPKEAARYVIELPAGSVQGAGIKTGQIAEFNLEV